MLAEVKASLLLSSESDTLNKYHFCAMFLTFVGFLVILLFKMALKHGAEVLGSAPTHRKAVVCHEEKARLLRQAPFSHDLVLWPSSVPMTQQHKQGAFKQKNAGPRFCTDPLTKIPASP